MNKSRLEAFSDGVLAIIITIMVLGIEAPKGANFSDIKPLLPQLAIYLISFFNMAIYWVNHHNLTHALPYINFKVIWSNLVWLFMMSLVPLATAWVGAHPVSAAPLCIYGLVQFAGSLAFLLFQHYCFQVECESDQMRKNFGLKGYASLAFYLMTAACAFSWPVASWIFTALVAIMWLIPDRRMKRAGKI
ncbi:TMEM175 family protein [Lactobacillus sp.]|uniref:TMEM175 family protein n=1 Tax=Lactobacillus sp. TaxID=1591 RepID=UPI003EF8916D